MFLQATSISSPVKAGYIVSSVGSNSYLGSTEVKATIYAISCYTGLRYNGPLYLLLRKFLYIHVYT